MGDHIHECVECGKQSLASDCVKSVEECADSSNTINIIPTRSYIGVPWIIEDVCNECN